MTGTPLLGLSQLFCSSGSQNSSGSFKYKPVHVKTRKGHEGIKYQWANMGLTVFMRGGAVDKNGGTDKQT